jgi:hypothetical protein
MSSCDTESESRRRMPIQEIVKWWGIGGLVAGAIFGAVRVFLNVDGYALSRNIEAAYVFMAAIGAVAGSIPAMLIGLVVGLCLRLGRRTPTTSSKPASELVSPTRRRTGTGCLCILLGGLGGFWSGVASDIAESRRMAAEGRFVDFLPVGPILGAFGGILLGVIVGIALASRR